MKLVKLRKKITTNILITAMLAGIFAIIIFYKNYQEQTNINQAQKIKAETLSLLEKRNNLGEKVAEIKKYQDLWPTISASKKSTAEVKISDIISRMNLIAEKYSINKPSIKMSIPENITGLPFKISTIDVLVSSGKLDFNAIDDVRAISFISELIESTPGYMVISRFEIKKTRDYSEQDLLKINLKELPSAVSVQVNFFWYSLVAKTLQNQTKDNSSSTNKTNTEINQTKIGK
ncbi:MAG: hypothetical protein SFV53_00315 [Rickettsiales bacterium]|nr:hypothetical protein [Rickettsiales bacterium]